MNDFNFRVFIIMRAPQKWYNIKGINKNEKDNRYDADAGVQPDRQSTAS